MSPTTSFDPATHTYTIDGEPVPSVTDICSVLTAGKYSGGQGIIAAARARGTAVHELCEAYDYGTLEEVPAELAGYVKAWADFCRDYRPEWLYIEHEMYSKELQMAGTCDRIGVIDGKTCVVDIKTTANMDRASKLALACQLFAYEVLYYRQHKEKIDGDSLGVQLKRDGNYTVHTLTGISDRHAAHVGSLLASCREIYYAVNGRPLWKTKN